MSYDNDNNIRSKDLVLAPNEAVFLQSKTSGIVKSCVGPYMVTISQQESLVIFDNKSKRFIETTNFDKAKQLFTTVPSNWYCVLKNPAVNGSHPEPGKSSVAPELDVGKKINIFGPTNFALYPGQMAKVIEGHTLRTNQYLLARVYDAERIDSNTGKILDAEGNEVKKEASYVNGQILVIKGTEVSFYLPPSGIEVIPVENNPAKGYVREAVTLERLEYCILKDEDGGKVYRHGPAVVFPKPTETFVTSPKGGYIFRCMELSPISGLYIKVIAEYKEGDVVHPVGEELFITGKEQTIYYPRPEHTIISYDGKLVHHAIAIPEGEGRYILNRLTGEIKTVKGPAMYLPDPRTEVVVKRKLTPKQCALWFPGNTEVSNYNDSLTEKSVEKAISKGITTSLDSALTFSNFVNTSLDGYSYLTASSANDTLAYAESNAKISRGTSYTKPRTITLDNKMDGIVTMEIWNNYAVNVISKSGKREVVCGPAHLMLDYDQTLEPIRAEGNETVFLKRKDNKIADVIDVESKDFVRVRIKLEYSVNFVDEAKDKWFDVEDYSKYLRDDCRAVIRQFVKNYTIEDFWNDYTSIVRSAIGNGRSYENGMIITNCEVQEVMVEQDIEDLLIENKHNAIRLNMELANAEKETAIATAKAVSEKANQELRTQKKINEMALLELESNEKSRIQSEQNRKAEAEELAKKQAVADLQPVLDAISVAQRKRDDEAFAQKLDQKKKEQAQEIAHEIEMANIEEARKKAYADMVAKIIGSVSEDLTQALVLNGKMNLASSLTDNVGAYALAENSDVVEVAQKLVNGLPYDLRELIGANAKG